MNSDTIDEEIKKLNTDINKVIEDVIDEACHETKSKKKSIKYNMIFLINLVIVLISYRLNQVSCSNNVISVELACNTVCGDWLALLLPLDDDDVDPLVPLEPLNEDVVVVTSIKKIEEY